MKHYNKLFAVAALLAICAMCSQSCNKSGALAPNTSNPTEYSLKGAPFSLTVLDQERGYNKDSLYVFEGVWRDGHFWFGLEKKDSMQLNITPNNGITLKVASEVEGFQGVNAASSSRCINIVPDGKDHTSFHLQWIDEGQSTITLWCGEGASRRQVRFVATSKKEIPMEGIMLRLDGQEFLMNKTTLEEMYNNTASFKNKTKAFNTVGETKYKRNDIWTGYVKLEIVGPQPLNATNTTEFKMWLDQLGMADHYASLIYMLEYSKREKKPIIDWIWGKGYGIYEQNKATYKKFRWFHPLVLEEGSIEILYQQGYYQNKSENDPEPIERSESKYGKLYEHSHEFYNDPLKYTFYPCDIRERRILVFPACLNRYMLYFYQGAVDKESGFADTMYRLDIQFDGMLSGEKLYESKDYHPLLKSEHGYYEPGPMID